MSSGLANVNPQTWVSFDLADKKKMQIFLKQLADWATWMQSGGAAAGINSLPGVLFGSSLYSLNDNLGTISSNPTVDCKNYYVISISCNAGAAARTINLTNLQMGAIVFIYVQNIGTHLLQMTATDPSSTAYTIFNYYSYASANAKNNMGTGATSFSTFDWFFIGRTTKIGATTYLPLLGLTG